VRITVSALAQGGFTSLRKPDAMVKLSAGMNKMHGRMTLKASA
jgi:hypothetical protein